MEDSPVKQGGMYRLARHIVAGRKLILILTAALMVFCAISSGWVKVDNELSSYLSEDSEARRGLKIMDEEFVTYGSAQVMVCNLTAERAQELSDAIAAVDGVAMVTWDETDAHWRDGTALYSVTFDAPEDDAACETALASVRTLLADEDTEISSEVGYSLSETIASEMTVVVIIVAIVVVAVLVFTSDTYAEVIVLVLTFLGAALLNKGTNFLLGTISFVSNSVAIVLQLALSVDYAIIFCNRYKEEHARLPQQEAVVAALSSSVPVIASSSLTTLAGLASMIFMQFRLGADLGIVLMKAIVCSLLSVFILMPALLMVFGKWMDKTRHKNFVPRISGVGRFAWATRHVIPILFIAVFVGAFYLYQNVNYAYSGAFLSVPKQNEQQLAEDAIADTFGDTNTLAVLVPSGDYASEQALLTELAASDEVDSATGLASVEAVDGYRLGDKVTAADFAALAGVDSTTAQALLAYYAAENGEQAAASADLADYEAPLVDLFLFLHDKAADGAVSLTDAQLETVNGLYDQLSLAQEQLQGENYSRLVLTLNIPTDGEESFRFIDRIHVIAAQYYDDSQVVTVGTLTNAYDFSKSFEQDNLVVSLSSLLLVMVILFFTFRSFGMPLLLILIIQGSICINFGLTKLMGSYVFFMCYLIVSAIQMGTNIDYAIVISSRYQELRKTRTPREAIVESLNLGFPTVITSGTIMVVAGLLIWRMVSQEVISGIGQYVGIGTMITLVLVLFALPQVLLLGDGFARVTTLRAWPTIGAAALRRAGCGLLAAASLFALVSGALGLRTVSKLADEQTENIETLRADAAALSDLAASLDTSQTVYDATKLSFAEHVVTDSVGQTQLDAGQAEYDAGAAELSDGQAEYDAGAAELADAKEQYAAAQAQLTEAREQYAAGEAQLTAAREDYAAGEAELAAGKEKLAAAEPVYNVVQPLYAHYTQLQAQYDAAVSSGNTVQAALLWPTVTAAKAAMETQLSGTGYSIESLVQEYEAGQAQIESGQAQLDEAAAQIAAGQAQLDEAAAQIEAGQAQLDEAAAQIAAGQTQLDTAKQTLDAGYDELDSAGAQLDAGRATLAENRTQLAADLAALDDYTDARERLDAGVTLLLQQEVVSGRVGDGATYAEICTAAQDAFDEEATAAQSERTLRAVLYALLLAAGALGLAAGLLGFALRGRRAAVGLSAASTLLALAATLAGETSYDRTLSDGSGSGTLQFVAALLLTLTAFAVAELLRRRSPRVKETEAE